MSAVAIASALLVAVGPAGGQTARSFVSPAPVQVRLTFIVHADRPDTTPVNRVFRIEAPAEQPEMAALVRNRPGSTAYVAALQKLLSAVGLFAPGFLPLSLALSVDHPPRISVHQGRAIVVFSGTRDLAADLGTGASILGNVDSSHGLIRYCLDDSVAVPPGVAWTIDAYVGGASVLSTVPTPLERDQVARFPTIADVEMTNPVPSTVASDSGVTHVRWTLAGSPPGPLVRPCGPPTTTPKPTHAVALEFELDDRSRIAVASFNGLWAHLRLALSYLVATIFFIPLLFVGIAILRTAAGRRLRLPVSLAFFAWFALLVGGAVTWLMRPGAEDVTTAQAAPALFAFAAAAVAIGGFVRRRWAWVAVGAVVVITASAYLAQRFAGKDPFSHGGWPRIVGIAWAAFVIALFALATVARLTWLLLAEARGSDRSSMRRRRWGRAVSVSVTVIASLLMLQAASGGYGMWRDRLDATRALAEGLFGGWQPFVVGQVLFFPLGFLSLVADLLSLVALAIMLAMLSTAGREASGRSFGPGERIYPTLVLLMFASFVVGTEGSLYSWTVPLAFLLALALSWLLHKLAVSPPDEIPARDSDAALQFGPGTTWWANGRIATRAGLWLAIIPISFFIYVLISKRLIHDLSPWNSVGLFDILRSCLHEVLFWGVAAFALGALFAYLPGRWGAAKAAVLAAIYLLAQAVSVWLLPANPSDWLFRAFELLVFLVVLGVWLDRTTLVANGRAATDLAKYYKMDDTRFVSGYASAAIGTLLVIGQQLQSGHAQNAIVQIVTGFQSLLPPLH